jgi:hypothetical protein
MQETKQTYEDANQSQSETTNTINELECESAVYEGEAYKAGRKVNKESLKRFRKKYAENRTLMYLFDKIKNIFLFQEMLLLQN